jgi:hypothetical protein
MQAPVTAQILVSEINPPGGLCKRIAHFYSGAGDFWSDCFKSEAFACGARYTSAPHATTKLLSNITGKLPAQKCAIPAN